MSKIIRRSFSLFRGPSTSSLVRRAARDGHETIHIQRVHLQRRFFTKPRVVGTAFALGGTYAFLAWFDGVLEKLELEEEEGAVAGPKKSESDEGAREGREITDAEEDEVDEEEEEEGLIFFPTGFSRPKPKTFYKGSDPEWQEFVKIAPDRKRLDRIRAELVSTIRQLAVNSPQYTMRLGKINPQKGNTWIDVRFPDGPPIEYERPGYELTDELNFRKTTRDVHELHHQRMKNLLVPSAVANSLYQDSKRKAAVWWKDTKKYMGWQDKPETNTAQKLLTQFPAPPASAPTTPAASTTASSATTPLPAPSATPDGDKQATPSSSSPLGNPAYERFGLTLPDPTKVPTLDLSHFRHTFRHNHRHFHLSPPRGTFIVSGLIEIVGDRAKMTLDVTAAYDPKMGRYVMLRANLRHVVDYQQRPKGGS
ncbi:hypothetical protein CC80DRAFT_440888 [Byssothecium circinans]|uniref:Uncharacterized protein n=1 Tax=Byssothecium circinans TaxID=147558 RepID=A0A6A5U411_9PLEO|nr:hypothetical protein CC80DRAFT_440888 [Byssothecium circinans]